MPIAELGGGEFEFAVDEGGHDAAVAEVSGLVVVALGGGNVVGDADDLGPPSGFGPFEEGVASAAVAVEGHADGASVDDKAAFDPADEGDMGMADAEDGDGGSAFGEEFLVVHEFIEATAVAVHGGMDAADDAVVGAVEVELGGPGVEGGEEIFDAGAGPADVFAEFDFPLGASGFVEDVEDVVFVVAADDEPAVVGDALEDKFEAVAGAGAAVDDVAGEEDAVGTGNEEMVDDGVKGVPVGVDVGEDGDAHG